MKRFDNPYCLDPKETSCPRLENIGMIYNRITGTLEPIEQPAEFPKFLETQTNRPTPLTDAFNKIDPKGSFIVPKEKRLKGLLAPDRFRNQLLPEDLQRVRMMYPEEYGYDIGNWEVEHMNASLEGDSQNDGFLVWKNDKTKELRFVFRGAEGDQDGQYMKWNVLLGEDSKVQNSRLFKRYDTKIADYISRNPNYDYEFVGYSFGAYKARYFASLYGGDQHLFNAHIMPFSQLGENGGKSYYHTIVSDDTNFKYWMPVWNGEVNVDRESTGEETHTLYLPLKDIPPNMVAGDHSSGHFTEVGERYVPHEYGVGVLSLAGAGLGVAEVGILASGNRPSSSLDTTAGVVGTVQTGIDAPVYEMGEASANDTVYFLDRFGITNWLKTSERKRQEQQLQIINEGNPIVQEHPLADDPSVQIGKGKTYTTNPDSTFTDPETGKVYEEVIPSN